MDKIAKLLLDELALINDIIDKDLTAKKSLEKRINEIQSRCSHSWQQPVRKSHTTPGYEAPNTWTHPGRTPVHSRTFWVEEVIDVWYERTCQNCGKVEKTDKTKPTGAVTPVFRGH